MKKHIITLILLAFAGVSSAKVEYTMKLIGSDGKSYSAPLKNKTTWTFNAVPAGSYKVDIEATYTNEAQADSRTLKTPELRWKIGNGEGDGMQGSFGKVNVKGKNVTPPSATSESIWNFHVWVDAFRLIGPRTHTLEVYAAESCCDGSGKY